MLSTIPSVAQSKILRAFLPGALAANLVGTQITSIPDTSGNNGGSIVSVTPGQSGYGNAVLTVDSSGNQLLSQANGTTFTYLSTDNAIAQSNGNNITVLTLLRPPTNNSLVVHTSYATNIFYAGATRNNNFAFPFGNSQPGIGDMGGFLTGTNGLCLVTIHISPTDAQLWINDCRQYHEPFTGSTSPIPSGGIAIALGGCPQIGSNYNWSDPIGGMLIYQNLTSNELFAIQQQIMVATGITDGHSNSATTGFVVYIGDSETAGAGTSGQATNFPSLINSALNPIGSKISAYDFYQMGIPSTTTPVIIDGLPTSIPYVINQTRPTVAHIWEQTNEIALIGASGAQAYSSIVTLCNNAKAMRKQNGGLPVIISGMLPRNGSGVEAARQACRALFLADFTIPGPVTGTFLPKAGVTYADAYNDVDTSVPSLGAVNANNVSSGYNSDQLHLSDSGAATFSVPLKTLIQTMFQTLSTTFTSGLAALGGEPAGVGGIGIGCND